MRLDSSEGLLTIIRLLNALAKTAQADRCGTSSDLRSKFEVRLKNAAGA